MPILVAQRSALFHVTQRAINGPYIYFVTTNTTYREVFFVDKKQVELLRRIIQNACRIKHFDLLAFCILPDHIHLLVYNRNVQSQRGFRNPRCDTSSAFTLSNLMHSIKRNFARQQPVSGRLWQPRFNFRIIDNDKRLFNTIRYIKYNYQKIMLPKYFGRYPWVFINNKRIRNFYEK